MKKFANIFLDKIKESDLANSGAVLAYNMLFSIFPFIIVLLNIVSFAFSGYESEILGLLNFLPTGVSEVIRPVVLNLLKSSSGGLLSISLVMALWSSSNAMGILIDKVNNAFGYDLDGGFVKKKLLAIALSLALILIIMVMLVSGPISSIIKNFLEWILGENLVVNMAFDFLISLLPYLFIIIILTVIYKISVFREDIYLKDIIPASLFSTLALFILTLGFTIYIENFASFSSTYGYLGGVIVLLLWMYFTGIVIILGAYFAASIIDYRQVKLK